MPPLSAAVPSSLMVDLSSLAYSKSTAVMAEMPEVGIAEGSTVFPKAILARIAIFAWWRVEGQRVRPRETEQLT